MTNTRRHCTDTRLFYSDYATAIPPIGLTAVSTIIIELSQLQTIPSSIDPPSSPIPPSHSRYCKGDVRRLSTADSHSQLPGHPQSVASCNNQHYGNTPISFTLIAGEICTCTHRSTTILIVNTTKLTNTKMMEEEEEGTKISPAQ